MTNTAFLQPIAKAHEDCATDKISQRDENLIMDGAGERNVGRVLADECEGEYKHVRHAVLEPARNESKHRPENEAKLRAVIIRPTSHPDCQASEPIPHHALRTHRNGRRRHFPHSSTDE